jgi:general secretion pathway protein F
MFSVLVIFALIVIFFAVVEIVRRHRRMKQQVLLGALAATVDRGVPLTQTLDAFAHEMGGFYGVHVAQFSHLLKQGMSVPGALYRTPKVFPNVALPLLLIGFDAGAPGEALRRSLKSVESRPVAGTIAGRLVYLAIFILMSFGILTFLMVKIAPIYGKIFVEFGQDLPPVTLRFLDAAHLAYDGGFLVWISLFLPLIGIYGVLRYFGVITWDPPGVGRLTRRLRDAAVIEGLALAVENRQPLPSCLATLARQYPQSAGRGQLNGIATDLESGMAVWDVLYSRGLIGRADRTLLEAAHRAGNLDWALSEVAAHQRRRWFYQLHYTANLLYPALVLLMGALVLFTMLAFFSPLVQLIKHLAGGY